MEQVVVAALELLRNYDELAEACQRQGHTHRRLLHCTLLPPPAAHSSRETLRTTHGWLRHRPAGQRLVSR